MATINESLLDTWQPNLDHSKQKEYAKSIESGELLYFSKLAFKLTEPEHSFLNLLPTTSKNISYNPQKSSLSALDDAQKTQALKDFMQRYFAHSRNLIAALFPNYLSSMEPGLTSLRTVEAKNRPAASYRKDDTRLHIDAFPSRPTQGRRLLRVFANINPGDKNRVWRTGEPFEKVALQFLAKIKKPSHRIAKIKKLFKITKGFQTPYDQIMLQLHNLMKADNEYQSQVDAQPAIFKPGSVWMVFSDQVSHAVVSGQHMMEQTFYLPVNAMYYPEYSPLRILERLTHQPLL